MSFGGGTTQYFIDYIIRVQNQGGSASGGAFTQISNGMNKVQASSTNVTLAMEKMRATNEKVIQAGQGVSKAAKGMAFGFLGIATAGAEAIGMFSMYQQTQAAVKVAQEDVTRALQEGGKGSKQYKDAVNELAKANRWARMTFRNLMLSMFDLIPFFVLSVNGILKLRTAYKALREAQLEQAAMKQALAMAGIKEAAAANLQNASYRSLNKNLRLLKAQQALGITTTQASAVANTEAAVSLEAESVAATQLQGPLRQLPIQQGAVVTGNEAIAVSAKTATTSMRVMKAASVVLLPLLALEGVSQAIANNWGGLRDRIEELHSWLLKIAPALKPVIDFMWKLGESITAVMTGDIGKLGSIWGGAKDATDSFTQSSEKATKAMEEEARAAQSLSDKGNEIINSLASADKKERKSMLFDLGIKGGARKRFNDVLNDINDFNTKIKGVFDSMAMQKKLVDWSKIFKIPDSVFKKGAWTQAFRFKELAKDAEDDFKYNFYELANIAKLDAQKGGKTLSQDVAKYLFDHPAFLNELRSLNLVDAETEKLIRDQGAKARVKVDTAIQEGIRSGFGSGGTKNTIIDPNGGEMEAIKGTFGKGKNGDFLYKKKGQTGLLDGLVQSVQTGIEQLKLEIGKGDWAGVGATVRKGLDTALSTVVNYAMTWGTAIAQSIVAAFSNFNFAAAISSTNKFIGDVGKNIGDFIAGFLGFPDGVSLNQNIIYFFQTTLPKWITDGIKSLPGLVSQGISNLFSNAENVADQQGSFTDFLNEVIGPALGIAANSIGSIGEQFTGWFSNTVTIPILTEWDKIKTTIGKLMLSGAKAVDETIDFIPGLMSSVFGDLSNIATEASKWITTNIVQPLSEIDITGMITGALGIGGSGSGKSTEGIWDFVAEPNQDLLNWLIKTFIDPAVEAVKEFIDIAKSLIGGAVDTGKGMIKGFTDEIKSVFTDPLKWFQENIIDKIVQKAGATSGVNTTVKKSLINMVVTIDANEDALSNMEGVIGDTFTRINEDADTNIQGMENLFTDFTQQLEADFNATEVNWNNAVVNMLKDAKSFNSDTQGEFKDLNEQIEEEFNAMEENWANAMDNMKSDASKAVSSIKSDLNSIPTDITTVHHIVTEGSVAKGGQIFTKSFAQGGIISAASGRRLTTNGPTYLIGDNPGGQESIWAIPHNNPGPTVADINNYYGTSKTDKGSSTLNQQVVFHISGNDIINERRLNRRITTTMGNRMDRFG